MKSCTWRACLVIAVTLAGLTTLAGARAQSVEEFYQGKRISLLIGFGAGGGNDRWARLLAQHMGNHIPGRPTIIPKNMPGAGGLKVVNYLYNAAPKDGTEIGLVSRGIPLEPLLGGRGTSFDALRLNWLGSPTRDTTVCAVWHEAPVQTLQDLYKKELIVGATGSGAETNIYPLFLKNLLGLKFKIVRGYKGSSAIFLAMEQGEVGGVCLSYDSISRRAAYKQGKIKVLFQAGLAPDPALADLPFITDRVGSKADKAALELFFKRVVIGRPFVAPPGVEAARMQALRDAFAETMSDPAFLADAEKGKFSVDAVNSAELTQVIADAYATPPEVVRRVIAALGRGGK